MIDTVILRLKAEYAPDIDFMAETSCYINVTGESLTNGVPTVKGYLDNLRVYISPYSVNITGSLCKWYLGNNIRTLTFREIKQAFEKLGDTLKLPIFDANITRLDVGTNFILKHPPEQYFEHLGEMSKHIRIPITKKGLRGVNYSNSKRVLKFYNKTKEMKHRQDAIPDEFQGLNILRVELSIEDRVAAQFQRKRLTTLDLLDPNFYINLVGKWQDYYNLIYKTKTMKNIDIAVIPSVKGQASAALKIIMDEQGGEALFCQRIREAHTKGLITYKQMSAKINDARKANRTDFTNVIDNDACEIMDELDTLIEQAVEQINAEVESE